MIAALVTIGAAERQNIFTVKNAARLNGRNKKTPNALCGKKYTTKGISAGQHRKTIWNYSTAITVCIYLIIVTMMMAKN